MARLGDICKKGTSNIAQKDLEGHIGNYPIYGASGFITNVDFYQQEKPYIAVVKDGAGIGRIMKLPAKSSVISTMQYIIPNDTVDISYLAYAMEHMNLAKYFSGATIPHIYFKDYQKEQLSLPPLAEQRKIAAVLDKVSGLIAKRRQQLDKLDELVKSRFIEMFGEKYPFDKIENLIDRKIVSAKKIFSQHDVIKYIDISSIDNIKNKIDRYTEYQMTDAPSRAQQCIKENDIIVSTVRPNLKNIAINQMEYDNLVVSSGFCVLRPKKCNPLYLFIALLQDNFTNKMIEKTTGANYPAIKDSDVYLFQIPLPPIELQNQFAAFVKQTKKTKSAISHSLQKLETLKKALMQEYFK